MIITKFIENIKSFLFDKDEYLTCFDNNVHIYGLEEVITLSDTLIKVITKKKTISITGKKIVILKLTKEELLINGIFERITFND